MPADAPGRARQEEIVRKLKAQGTAPLTADEERRLKELERQQMELRRRNEYRTITVQDTYKANFNSGTLQVEAGDQIDIRVFDADPIVDDLAGKTELLLTREILEKGAVDLKFGQVRSLKLTFKPL
jgi:hypothetical protein